MPELLSRDMRLSAHCGTIFRILAWQGEGSFARVYEAIEEPRGTRCAVKIAKPEIPEAADWLRHEIAVLDGMRHPNLVRLLGHGEREGLPFLVLEWLDGETLRDHVRGRRRLPLRRAVEILRAVWLALEILHRNRRSHGDVRPENVLVLGDGRIVLADPGFMTAEGKSPSAEDDVQASGRLFHLALTGELPDPAHVRLVRSAGFNRDAVRLWEATQSETPPAAASLVIDAERMLAQL